LWQLALALELATLLPGLKGKPQFFDPCLSPLDRRLVAAAGGELLHEDERGAHQASEATLLYMPACPVPMYQYLLEANIGSGADGGTVNSMAAAWGVQAEGEAGGSGHARYAGLQKLVVLGTSLEYLNEHARLVQQQEAPSEDGDEAAGSSSSSSGASAVQEEAAEGSAEVEGIAAAEAAPDEGDEVEDDMSDEWLVPELLQEVLQHGGVASYEIPDFALLHANSVTRLTLFGSAKGAAA
jgi:hypothetical protein